MTGFRVLGRVPGLIVLMALTAVVTSLPVKAQDNHVQRYGEKDKDETAAEKAAKKEAERAYQRSLGNIPTQKATDPWGTVRSDDAPKAATRTASPAPKPKAKSTAADAKNDVKNDSAAKQ